jgi:hypothetical protein
MKLKLSLVLAVLAVSLSAVVAVAAPSAQAKKGGSITTDAAGVTNPGAAATAGTFTITGFKVVNGAITAVGTFTGTIAGVNGDQTVTSPATAVVTSANGRSLSSGTSTLAAPAAAAAAAGSCQILDLTLGPLHLDLLGLVVDLNQVHLQITAQQGSGNLLGNLLCAVAGLLDNTGTGGLTGLLQSVTNLLNQILGAL